MILNIQVETSEKCGFNVLDTTCGDSGYLPESSLDVEQGRFKYSDTITLIRLTLNKIEGSITNPTIYNFHTSEPDYIYVPTEFDGWFTLDYIVIPTKTWFDSTEQKDEYETIYYSDGIKIYKYFNQESTEVSEDELFERNIEDTTISKYTQDFMSICFLKKCFINLCKQIFELRGFSKCKVKGSIDDQLIFNRDLIWMSINIISYLTEFGQLAEAQRLLEALEGECNTICRKYSSSNTTGCGCLK